MSQTPGQFVRPRFALLLAIALGVPLMAWNILPMLSGPRKVRLTGIISNLKQIDLAKEMWALDHAATSGVKVSEHDLVRHLGPRTGSTGLVLSFDAEVYRPNPVGTPSEAQLEKAIGKFPKGTLFRWNTNRGCEFLLPNPKGGVIEWQPLRSQTNRVLPAVLPVARP